MIPCGKELLLVSLSNNQSTLILSNNSDLHRITCIDESKIYVSSDDKGFLYKIDEEYKKFI